MPGFLRQATASQARAIGPFVDDTDFKTPETGLTIANTDIKLVINGAASANKNSGGGTHRVNGVYGLTFDATDTATVGELEVSVLVSGALLVFDKWVVVEEAVYDALYAASATGVPALGALEATSQSIKTKTDFLPSATAGAAGGVLIAGSNAATTFAGLTTGALAITTLTASGAVAFQSTFAVTGTTTLAAVNTGAIGTGTITTTGNVSVSGTVTLTGAVTANNAGNAITGVTAALTGDLTATMKTSVTTAATAATPNLNAAYDAAKTAAQAGDAMSLTGGERTTLAGVIWATTIATGATAIQAMRGFIAAMLGKAAGLATTTATYRNIADSKDVITATVDADGNRTAVTLDLT